MTAIDQLQALLCDPRFADDSTDDDLSDAILNLAANLGWNAVDSALIAILRDTNRSPHWYDVVAAFFCSDCHERDLPNGADFLIAALYDCLRLHPNLGNPAIANDEAENLVWSIVAKLKSVEYLSDYNPQTDPAVLEHRIVR